MLWNFAFQVCEVHSLCGLTSVPVDGVDGLDEEQRVAFGVLDEDEQQLERRLHHQPKLQCKRQFEY